LEAYLSNEQEVTAANEINRKKQKVNLLAVIIIIELVLGGSGRLIAFGSLLTIRYILFLFALAYFAASFVKNKFTLKRKAFYIDIILFFFMFFVSLASGIYRGYDLGNILRTSQGYLYLLIYFPFSIMINNTEKSKKMHTLFANCTVVLAIISIAIFVIFKLNPSSYSIITPILNRFNYGYIAMRGGLPAVFLKTSPYMAIGFIIFLFQFINIKDKRNITNLIKLLLLLIGCIATMSMGIWIAVFVGVFLVIVLSEGKYKRAAIISIAFISVIIMVLFLGYISESLGNRLSTSDSSYIVKFNQLLTLIDYWAKHPLLGNGFGVEVTFTSELGTREMINFELFWVQILVNMGILGFLLYSNIIVKALYYSIRTWKDIPKNDMVLIKSLGVGLIALCIVSSVNPFLNNPIGIGYLILVLSTISVYTKENLNYEKT